LFSVPDHSFSGLGQLPIFAILGVLAGLLAVVVCKGLFAVEAGYRRVRVGEFWHPIIGAAAFAVIGLAVPRALGVGYDVIDDALAGRLAAGTLIALCIGKTVMWWLALGSGTSGGTLAPVLIIGATFGGLYATGLHELWPGLNASHAAIVLVAMAATFGASTRATFTAIVFAFELTRDYDAILPLIGAVVLADLVSGALLDHGLMTEKLARRGLDVPRAYVPDALQTVRVSAAMTPVDPAYTSGANGSAATVSSRATLLEALETMLDDDLECVEVADNGRVTGVISRTDVLQARASLSAGDRIEDGWMARLGRFKRNGSGRAR
jgi:CBS domain-containing protein